MLISRSCSDMDTHMLCHRDPLQLYNIICWWHETTFDVCTRNYWMWHWIGLIYERPKKALAVLRSHGDQDSLSTFTEPRSIRFLLKLHGAVRSTSLDKLCYILYTRSVSRPSLPSGFKVESLPPTAAAAKFHSYRAYIAVQQLLAVPRQRWGDEVHWQHTVSQLRLWWTANNGPPALLPANWWALLLGRPPHRRREGNGMCPHMATSCVGNNLCPIDWGWQYRDESLLPFTTDWPVAPTRVLRIVRLQDRLSEDMPMPEGRVVLFTHVQLLQWTNVQQRSCASRQSRFRQCLIEVWMLQQLSLKCFELCLRFTSFVLLVTRLYFHHLCLCTLNTLIYTNLYTSYTYIHADKTWNNTLRHNQPRHSIMVDLYGSTLTSILILC